MKTTRYAQSLAAFQTELQTRLASAAAGFNADPKSAPRVTFAPARDVAHGDFATAAALAAGKQWKCNPLDVARAVAADGVARMTGVASLEVKPPGFINLR